MDALRSLDIKGVIYVSLLLVFGLSANQISELMISKMEIDNAIFNEVLDYSIKVAVLSTAIIKMIIEARKLVSKRKYKDKSEKKQWQSFKNIVLQLA